MSPDWVVIPAQNEAATIADVVAAVAQTGAKVVVVDDFSSDDTATLATAAGAIVLSLCSPLGAWGATQAGLRYVHAKGAQTLICMDADGQHPVSAISTLLAAQAQTDSDLVIGSDPSRGSWQRKLAWAWLRMLSGESLRDLTSGFRCCGPKALERLVSADVSLLNYQDIGVLLSLKRAGLTIIEVPVEMGPRGEGASRIFASWWRVGLYLMETTALTLAMRRMRSKNL